MACSFCKAPDLCEHRGICPLAGVRSPYAVATRWSEGSFPSAMDALRQRSVDGAKDPNPKDSIGSSKIPMHLWPETATVLGSLALLDGALKYGRSNYRGTEVRASIYYDAAKRHLNAWFEGEAEDPDSEVPHLGHALACLAILVDAEAAGKLNDDRNVRGGYRKFINALTPHVKRLQEKHADKSPKHYTMADNAQ